MHRGTEILAAATVGWLVPPAVIMGAWTNPPVWAFAIVPQLCSLVFAPLFGVLAWNLTAGEK